MSWANDEGGRIFEGVNGFTPQEAFMFVIAGVSGRTGSVVASTLLERGHQVRVVVRDAKQGAAWQGRGAEVAVASLDDAAALQKALAGADGVYALIPPAVGADDPQAAQGRVVDAWAQAIEGARPKHVVLLSSVGADRAEGTGPIRIAHRAEEKLGRAAQAATFLRAAYFQENWAGVVAPMKSNAILPAMIALGRPVAMVATADIGRVAAEALIDGVKAPKVIELAGPRDYTPEEVATIFGGALGKTLQVVAVPDEAIVPALEQAGFKPKLAALFREMYAGLNSGHIAFRGTPTRGRIELAETARQLAG
ncbi:MAG: hypothetical protein JWN44_1431 [Myxococcales bacterium]|nr:hypothetical protein [Myxococcales bacterium]